jgi:hypothetical protein
MEAETWKGESLEIPDFDDTFIYVQPEAVFPRSFEYEAVYSDEFSREDRITIDGIEVCIEITAFAIEVMIEGEMDESKANALVQDIKEGVEADTGRPYALKTYT